MKFTPDEMAIDAADVDASKATPIARGSKEWQAFLAFKRGFVRLEPDLRKFFKDERAVNRALRKVKELQEMKQPPAKRRKSA